jgi:CrcB protein
MLKNLLFVGIGGAAGSIFRYLISVFIKNNSHNFPWQTFTANIIGCFLIGVFFEFFEKHLLAQPEELKLLMITGFCGGLTTFSTFSAEGISLIQTGHYATAIIYIVSSIMAGLITLIGGIYIVKIIAA